MQTLEILIGINTFVVLGFGTMIGRYVVQTERRLTIIEKHLKLI